MVLEFEFPDTGEGVTEGQFLEWKIEEGDEVEEDQILAEAETDKAVVDIPSPKDGIIKELKAEPGDNVKVGDVILLMETGDVEEEEPEEAVKSDNESNSPEDQETKVEKEEEKTPERNESLENDNEVENNGESILALPKVRKLAEEKKVDLGSIKIGERITEEEVLEAAGESSTQAKKKERGKEDSGTDEKKSAGNTDKDRSSSSEVLATPSVRKLAREEDVDLQNIEGSGRGGKVTRDDVLTAGEAGEEDREEEPSEEPKAEPEDTKEDLSGEEFPGEVEYRDLSSIRKSIGEKMAESRFTAPHVTHVENVDLQKLVELREEEKEDVDVHLTYLPFIMKAALIGLKHHPGLNAELDEENDRIVEKKYYNFNIAVDTEKGLMVPVLEDVDDKSIVELAENITEKAKKAKEGELSASEMKGGTFSITNLGVIGGEEFTPIINYPQTAILGIGEIQETAEVVDGRVRPRYTVKLSLSYDHRVVDGAEAARFMNKVVENLENPEEMMMEI